MNMHNMAMVVNSMHKIRSAEDLGASTTSTRARRSTASTAARTSTRGSTTRRGRFRKVTQRSTAVDNDWRLGSLTNVVFEPLLGELFRSDLVEQIVPRTATS